MCILAIFRGMSDRFPIILAGNRDELYERPSLSPLRISDRPGVIAGLDLVAGGTWMGINEHGVAAAILNRRNSNGPDPSRQSRGALCLRLLQESTLQSAVGALLREPANQYNCFNLVLAAKEGGIVALHRDDQIRVSPLRRGLTLISNLEPDDRTCTRITTARPLLQEIPFPTNLGQIPLTVEALREVFSRHASLPESISPMDHLCIHTSHYGTRSSSAIFLGADGKASYWHAEGPPCGNTMKSVSLDEMRVAGHASGG